MIENTNKNTILLIHGFKRNNRDDFKFLKEHLSVNFNVEVISFSYYSSNNKKTINNKNFKREILNSIKDVNGKIDIIGYSLGGFSSLTLFSKNKKIENIYAIFPPFKISFFNWILKLKNNWNKKRLMKKRIGKDKFKKIQLRYKQSSMLEKHPIKLIHEINVFRFKNKRKIKFNQNKNIKILFSNSDPIVNNKRTITYINKKIHSSNQLEFKMVNNSHFEALNKNSDVLEDISIFLNLK